MLYRISADLVLIIHLIFIIFVVIGGLFLLKNKKWMIIHLPAIVWAIVLEIKGWICPLTPIENWLRAKGGQEIYNQGFIDHYLIPIIYPDKLTRRFQIILACLVIVINAALYLWAYRKTYLKVKLNLLNRRG